MLVTVQNRLVRCVEAGQFMGSEVDEDATSDCQAGHSLSRSCSCPDPNHTGGPSKGQCLEHIQAREGRRMFEEKMDRTCVGVPPSLTVPARRDWNKRYGIGRRAWGDVE